MNEVASELPPVIVGDPANFAIESEVSLAYERESLLALGLFVIHVSAMRYGVYAADATMLSCSFHEVERRIANRGRHFAPFATETNAELIANACRIAYFADETPESLLGIGIEEFKQTVDSGELVWAPDGDEAFDDGSYILQFDIQDSVRLIAFRCDHQTGLCDRATLRESWLTADDFYQILREWRAAFEVQWVAMPKQ